MTRWHVHALLTDRETDAELANVTITLEANDDADAQERVWSLFPDQALDIEEIEVAE